MKHPVIPMDKPITFSDWAKGREARRQHGLEVAPATVRRTESSSDKRLRKLFNGKRAPVKE